MHRIHLAVVLLALTVPTACADTSDLEACCACLAETPAPDGAADCFGVDESDGEPLTEKKCVTKGTAELNLGSDGEFGIAVADVACGTTLCADSCPAAVEQGITLIAPPKSAGLVQATIDGVEFIAGFVTAFIMPIPDAPDQTSITIQGHVDAETAAGDEKLSLRLGDMAGPGTYPMLRRTFFEVFNEGDALPEPSADAEPGAYVVTELSDTHIVGTFEATMHRFVPEGTYEITAGSFDVDLAPPASTEE